MMKVVVNARNDKVVGIHLVGAEVAEILQVALFSMAACTQSSQHVTVWRNSQNSGQCILLSSACLHAHNLPTACCLQASTFRLVCSCINKSQLKA